MYIKKYKQIGKQNVLITENIFGESTTKKNQNLKSSYYSPIVEYSIKSKNIKIFCEKRINRKCLKVIVAFIKFCNNKLNLINIPHIFFHVQKKPYMTTGSYILHDRSVHVLIKNRLLIDILKTLSHELVHHAQYEKGFLEEELSKIDLTNKMSDLNTLYENEAYIKSGNFVKEFTRIYRNNIADDDIDIFYENILFN